MLSDGIVINMVVGGEVVTLNNIEESSNLLIAEMPINVTTCYIVYSLLFPLLQFPANSHDSVHLHAAGNLTS